MSDEKHPPTLEHQEPPIYYCWKYWTSDGEIREGCTPIEPSGHEGWPDINDYGWVYVAVPLAIFFIFIFLLSLICSKAGKKNSPDKKSILVEESESEDELPPPPKSQWSRVRSHNYHQTPHSPPQSAPYPTHMRDFMSVVHMAKPDNMSAPDRKVSPRGGVTPGKVYPQLSHKSARGPRADEEVTVTGKRVNPKTPSNGPNAPPLSHYVNNPSTVPRKSKPRTPPTQVAEESSSDEDLSDNNESHSDEENEE